MFKVKLIKKEPRDKTLYFIRCVFRIFEIFFFNGHSFYKFCAKEKTVVKIY